MQLGRHVDGMRLELPLHQLICGRQRKNIKLIESSTGTAIYFPPPISNIYSYCPPHARRRDPANILITGDSEEQISQAKRKLHEAFQRVRLFTKDVPLAAHKRDNILRTRLDKVRKIVEANSTYIMYSPLGSQTDMIRVQGSDMGHVDRTASEIMVLVCFLYN